METGNTKESSEFIDNESILLQIKNRYCDYLAAFQKDVDWLLTMEFYQDDEDVSGKQHSALNNCLEKLKGIGDMMQKMKADSCGSITIEK